MAVIINAADGHTHRLDLTDSDHLRIARSLIRQGQVRAMAVAHNGTQHVLRPPRKFGRERCHYGAELMLDKDKQAVGERVWCQIGQTRVSLHHTFTSSVFVCEVVRTGRLMFRP